MKAKLYIPLTVVIVSLACFTIFFGLRMGFPEKFCNNQKTNATKVFLPKINYSAVKTDLDEPYYTAAVVEIETLNGGYDATPSYINQYVDIINSLEVNEADIIVFSEAVLNRAFGYIFPPNSTNHCDDPKAHYAFRNVSCAARKAKKYVVMNMYTRIKCADDDQAFCDTVNGNTNLYNMMFVYDRTGANIVKYRKFNPYIEDVAITAEPEVVSFKTDFNVTFGVIVCFDLIVDIPANILHRQGIRNFVFSTMWHNQLPYGNAVQYQQMWAYGHNVNLLASNANWLLVNTTGSGIYHGRAGALKVYVSGISTSKVLVARVPINLPAENEVPFIKPDEEIKEYPKMNDHVNINRGIKPLFDNRQIQMDLSRLLVEFLDFSSQSTFNGSVCHWNFCCKYDIKISINTASTVKNGPTYFYAIAVTDDYHRFDRPKYLLAKQSYCSLIACTEMYDKKSCGKRFAVDVQERFKFDRLELSAVFQMGRRSKVFPSTLTNDLYPLNVGAFGFKNSKLHLEEKYLAAMSLKTPRSDLLTFALFSRDYEKDISAIGYPMTMNNTVHMG